MSVLAEAVRRLRVVDSYAMEWGNLLRDAETDPQMLRDVVTVVRDRIRLDDCGHFLAFDNSDPPQLWVWKGDIGDESAEPWQRVI